VSEGTDLPAESERSEDDEPILRAKYADFCSAQITEVFLSLSDERIYDLVQEEARSQRLGEGNLGFRTMVRLATQRLRDSVPLPDYETWREEYRADPERYDRYLLGLWKHLVAEADSDADAGTVEED
jgi:hypothetical protein